MSGVKELLLITLACMVLFSGCSAKKEKTTGSVSKISDYSFELAEQNTKNGLIQFKACPDKDNDSNYEGVLVKFNDKTKYFDWDVVYDKSYPPSVLYEDINNDGKDEIIFSATVGAAKGEYVDDIFILDSKTLELYQKDSVLNYINKNVDSQISEKLNLSINDKIQSVPFDNISGQAELYKKALFSNNIQYIIENNKLKALVGIQVSDLDYVGNLQFEYKFNKDKFEISNVEYKNIDYFEE